MLKVFDFPLSTNVICEEVACNPELLVHDAELSPQKLDEVPNYGRVRVCKSNGVAPLVSFGPIEHAPCDVKGVRALRSQSTLLLVATTSRATALRVYSGTSELSVVDRVA